MAKKLSASALGTYLKSPRSYYWRYIAKLEPIAPSVVTFDHDKICGQVWSEFVERFYNGMGESQNAQITMQHWHEQTDGWVPPKAKDKLTKALETWSTSYYQMFRPDDGCRTQSEVYLENDKFLGFADGLNDERGLHEVKSTSRSPQLSGQLWKVENSIQIKLYSVLADATSYQIEFAFKDPPQSIFRGPVVPVSAEQRTVWAQQLNTLADHIYSLGDDINNYVCNPDSCCLVTKGITSMCQYQALCDKVPGAEIAFKPRETKR